MAGCVVSPGDDRAGIPECQAMVPADGYSLHARLGASRDVALAGSVVSSGDHGAVARLLLGGRRRCADREGHHQRKPEPYGGGPAHRRPHPFHAHARKQGDVLAPVVRRLKVHSLSPASPSVERTKRGVGSLYTDNGIISRRGKTISWQPLHSNFREPPQDEVRRITLLRTRVDRAKVLTQKWAIGRCYCPRSGFY